MKRRDLGLILAIVAGALLLRGVVYAADAVSSSLLESPSGLIDQEGGAGYALAVQGTLVYVGMGPRLVAIDIVSPTTPALAGRSPVLPGIVRGIATAGDVAVVATGDHGIQSIDVSDVAAPAWLSSLETPGWAAGVAVAGPYAYVAAGDGGLRIVDISDPSAPLEVGSLSATILGGPVTGIAVAGSTAYLGAGAGGLVIVDVGAANAPSVLGSFTGPIAAAVAVHDATAYIIDSREVRVLAIDVADPAHPELVHSRPSTGVPTGLHVASGYLYVAAGTAGVDIFQIDPDSGELSYQTTHATPGSAQQVSAVGPYALVADGHAGLRVVDVLSDLSSPQEVGAYHTLGNALGLDTRDGLAYVAAGRDGLSILAIATSIAQTDSVDTPGYAQTVVVSDTLAFVAAGPGGLAIVDLANAAGPQRVGSLEPPGDDEIWRSLTVQGDLALVAAQDDGLRLVRVSDPAAPFLVGSLKPAGGHGVWAVAAQGTTAYLAAGTGGVRVVDISDPAAPVEIAQLPTQDWAWDLALDGMRLYVADIDGGLHIIDVSAPASPRRLSATVATLGAVTSVTVSGKHALVTTDDAAAIIDVADPSAPVVRATYPTAGTPQAVALADAVLVTDLDGGLRMLDPTDVAVAASHSPSFAEPGDPVTIRLTVTNEGPSSAQGVVVTTTLPAGLVYASSSPACDETAGVVTCALGELANGADSTITVTVTAPAPGSFDATAVVTNEATEIHLFNNTVTRHVTVLDEVSRTHLPLVLKAP